MSQGKGNAILPRLAAILAILIGVFLLFALEQGTARLRQARLAEEAGEYARAVQLYREVGKVFFWQRTHWQTKAAQSAYQMADYDQVIGLLAPLHERGLLPYEAQILLARTYLETANSEAVLSLRQEWVQRGYSTDPIDLSLLELLTEQGRFGQTLPILEALVVRQPEQAEWHYRLGLVLAAESPAQAIAPLQQAAQLDESYQPEVAVLLEQLAQPASEAALSYLYAGRGLASLDEWALALVAFQHAVEQRPDFAEAWAYLGLARLRLAPPLPSGGLQKQPIEEEERHLSRRKEARPGLDEIRFALQLSPHSQVALAFMTLYWQEVGDSRLALQSASRAFQLYPNDLNVRLQYAQALAQSGDLEAGWRILSEWVRASSDTVAARKTLVLYCVQYGFRLQEDALAYAKELVSQMPNDVESLDLLGQVYLGLQEWSQAQQTFERALSLDAAYAPALLHLGMIHLAQGNIAIARAQFQRVVAVSPYSPSGKQAQRYLEIYLP